MIRRCGLLMLALLLPTVAAGQRSQTREGLGISFGLGAGTAHFCSACNDKNSTEFSGYLRIGGYLSPSFFLAAESDIWVTSDLSSNRPTLGAIMGVLQWYPMVDKGLYFKAGLGYAYTTIYSDPATSGFAGSIGAGYDIRLARNFALTPYINLLRQFGGSYTYFGGEYVVPDTHVSLFQFGLGLTWF